MDSDDRAYLGNLKHSYIESKKLEPRYASMERAGFQDHLVNNDDLYKAISGVWEISTPEVSTAECIVGQLSVVSPNAEWTCGVAALLFYLTEKLRLHCTKCG